MNCTIKEQARQLELPPVSVWGPYESIEPTAVHGIIYVRAATHGGYWASQEVVHRVIKAFPAFVTFSGHPHWFEHDEDWAALALTVPAAFSNRLLRAALLTAQNVWDCCRPETRHLSRWRNVPTHLASPAGRSIIEVVRAWEHDHREMWERGSCWTDRKRDCWQSVFRNIGNASLQRLIPHRHYVGSGDMFTTEQLDLMERDAATKPLRRHPHSPAQPAPAGHDHRQADPTTPDEVPVYRWTPAAICPKCKHYNAILAIQDGKGQCRDCGLVVRLVTADPPDTAALDAADTAFAVLNLCDDLTPQARRALREAWPKVMKALAAHRPGSAYARAVEEVLRLRETWANVGVRHGGRGIGAAAGGEPCMT